jgi:hypothetical protein
MIARTLRPRDRRSRNGPIVFEHRCQKETYDFPLDRRHRTKRVGPGPPGSAKTIGSAAVAFFAASAAWVPCATMTSALARTNSAAISAMRSLRPSAQRYSIAMVCPSVQPSSRRRCTKAAAHCPAAAGVLAPDGWRFAGHAAIGIWNRPRQVPMPSSEGRQGRAAVGLIVLPAYRQLLAPLRFCGNLRIRHAQAAGGAQKEA